MSDPFSPRSADYLFRSTAILRGVQAGCRTVTELEEATALPQTTIIRVAAQLVADDVLKVRWVHNDIELTMAVRTDYRH